jgi:predicted CXXCH cytochrome family protein
VLFSHYDYTWEGGRRNDSQPGGSTINSGEARDFLLGGCQSQLACTRCHDPHRGSNRAALERMGTVAGNPTCTTPCHAALAAPAALAAHTHHKPDGEGSACLGCHMPKKNLGLDYALTRYHRIGSPTDPARVLRDRPVECALCHTDRSTESLVADMERLWGKRYDRTPLRALYGDLDGNTIAATLERGLPHEQAAAAGALEAHPAAPGLASLPRAQDGPIPLVNDFVRRVAVRLAQRR